MTARRIAADITDRSHLSELTIAVRQSQVSEWALEISLLLKNFSDALEVESPQGFRIVLTTAPPSRTAPMRSQFVRTASKELSARVARNQAESLQSVLLRAYRDRMSETGHIHLEGRHAGKDFDLTWLFDTVKPPMTAEEASRLMADD